MQLYRKNADLNGISCLVFLTQLNTASGVFFPIYVLLVLAALVIVANFLCNCCQVAEGSVRHGFIAYYDS